MTNTDRDTRKWSFHRTTAESKAAIIYIRDALWQLKYFERAERGDLHHSERLNLADVLVFEG